MLTKTILKGENIILRTLILSDIYNLSRLANDFDIATKSNLPYPYSSNDARYLIALSKYKNYEGKGLILGIVKKEENRLIGVVELNFLENKQYGTIGYWVGKEFQKRGYGTSALEILTNYCFRELKMISIYAIVKKYNEPSINLLKKFNFREISNEDTDKIKTNNQNETIFTLTKHGFFY